LSTESYGRTTRNKLRILSRLHRGKVGSLSSLAQQLGEERTSISRTAHALKALGLVMQFQRDWSITAAGEEYLQCETKKITERANAALRSLE
jgi:DNA-binding IclR family transcriptional regulator